MRVIGLDLSLTATGVALTRRHVEVLSVTTRGTDRLIALRDAVLKHAGGADLVVIEGYSFASRNSHAHALGELGGIIRVALAEAKVPYIDVAPTVVKKYATGHGNAGKGQMLVEAVRRLDYAGHNDNEADALWLREIGVALLAPSQAIALPAVNRTVLDKLELPAGLSVMDRAERFLETTELNTEVPA